MQNSIKDTQSFFYDAADAFRQAAAAFRLFGDAVLTAMPDEKIITPTVCPECKGKIQVLGPESRFCLDCDWDDLEAKKL